MALANNFIRKKSSNLELSSIGVGVLGAVLWKYKREEIMEQPRSIGFGVGIASGVVLALTLPSNAGVPHTSWLSVASGMATPNLSLFSMAAGISTLVAVDVVASAFINWLQPQPTSINTVHTTPPETSESTPAVKEEEPLIVVVTPSTPKIPTTDVEKLQSPEKIKSETKEELKETFLREFAAGQVRLKEGDYDSAIIHLANAVIVYGDRMKLLKQLHPLLPEKHWLKLLHLIRDYNTRKVSQQCDGV